MGEERQGGRVEEEVRRATAEQVWKMLDFCAIDKIMPSVASSERVEGVEGEVGCVRRCVGKPVDLGGEEGFVAVAEEKLVSMDREERRFGYRVGENNLGLRGYEAEMRVVEGGDDGCRIEWSFEAESYGNWGSRDAFRESLGEALRGIVQRIEDAVAAAAGED
ncbi:lachrymatory-factor synthase-like [Wolffia australiana]